MEVVIFIKLVNTHSRVGWPANGKPNTQFPLTSSH